MFTILHHFFPPRYNKWKTSTIKLTWTSVLKPKCTFNLNVIVGVRSLAENSERKPVSPNHMFNSNDTEDVSTVI